MASIPFLNNASFSANATFAGTVSSTGLSVDTTGLIQLGDISGASEGAILQVDNTEGYTRVVGTLSLAGGLIFENDVDIGSGENAVDWYDVTDFSLSTSTSIYLESNLITLDRYDSGNGNLVATDWDASFNSVTSPTFLGDLNGTINTATTGTTQTAGNNSTLIATTAYADAAAAAVPIGNYLPLAGGTMTGVTQFNDHTQHGDQVSAKWGAGNDLTIQHNATNSAISNSVGNLYISNHADDKDIIFECDNGSGASVSYLTLDGSTTHAYFSNPGNVGIGTTNPGAKLNVAGDILIDSGEYLSWGTVGSTSIEGSTASNKLQFRTNSSDRMIIDSSGNVGIGTASPGSLLHVDGNRTTAVFQANQTGSGVIANFKQAGSSKVLIDNGGNVGIGTTVPSSKLQVDGGIQMADDTATASAAKVGTLKYRVSGNNSYVDMCMQTGATTYAWINIVQNNW